jgi:hypothetical protein
MTDLSDVNMEGVKPMSEIQDLGVGQYLVRIEDTDKKETKDKYSENGEKLPPNHYLQIALKVYGGPDEGRVEFVRLNLWNSNPTAVNMAKSELKSIQDAIGVVTANSDHMHGKWLVLEIKAGTKDATKLYKHYQAAPEGMVKEFAHIQPVPAKAPSPAATVSSAKAATNSLYADPKPPASAAAAAPAAGSPSALPAWAQKKTA